MAEMKTENGLVVGLILPETSKEDNPAERSQETPSPQKNPKGKRNDAR